MGHKSIIYIWWALSSSVVLRLLLPLPLLLADLLSFPLPFPLLLLLVPDRVLAPSASDNPLRLRNLDLRLLLPGLPLPDPDLLPGEVHRLDLRLHREPMHRRPVTLHPSLPLLLLMLHVGGEEDLVPS